MGEEEKGWRLLSLRFQVSAPASLGIGGRTEVIAFHFLIHSLSAVGHLLCAWHPRWHWEPMSDMDSHRAVIQLGRLGQGKMYK